jgi:hypothetical protein
MCVRNDHGYVLFVVITIPSFHHSWQVTWCLTRVTRKVPPEKKELSTLPGDVTLPLCFSGVRVTQSLVFCSILSTICLLFLLFVLLSPVLLRITALDYQLNICQLFFGLVWFMILKPTFNNICCIVAVSFICGGNRSIRRKLPTYRKSLTNFIT